MNAPKRQVAWEVAQGFQQGGSEISHLFGEHEGGQIQESQQSRVVRPAATLTSLVEESFPGGTSHYIHVGQLRQPFAKVMVASVNNLRCARARRTASAATAAAPEVIPLVRQPTLRSSRAARIRMVSRLAAGRQVV
jgi:hypothetical protein